jgi:hypothetical protein
LEWLHRLSGPTIKRFQAAGLTWPLSEEMTDAVLEAKLFADAGTKQGHRRQVEPDRASIHRELKRKHVTLSILWDEYVERNPEGYRYSRFCELYRSWEGKLSVTDAPDPCGWRQCRRSRRRCRAGYHRSADRRGARGQAAARTTGRELVVLRAGSESDFESVFATLVQQRAGALMISADALFFSQRDQLVALAGSA